MRPEGLEHPRVAPPAPKAGASANSATVAGFREMYLCRVLLSSLQRLGSLQMNHPRVGIVALSLALGVSVPARSAAGQAATDKDRVCAQVQNRTPPVGSWASYNWTGGRSNGTTMRMAVVGQEPQDGKTYFWYEVTIADPKRPREKMILQMLVAGVGNGEVRTNVVKSGPEPAMKMPPQMIQMVNSSPGMNMAAGLARQCQAVEVVGWEQGPVPGGQVPALHLRGRAS